MRLRSIAARAALAGLPLSDFLIREVRKIAEQPTPDEMRRRLQERATGVIAQILAHMEKTAPDQFQAELPLGARAPPMPMQVSLL